MSEEKKVKYLSEIEKYELINVNDGEKYDYLLNNDLIIDDDGNFKYLIINLIFLIVKIFLKYHGIV